MPETIDIDYEIEKYKRKVTKAKDMWVRNIPWSIFQKAYLQLERKLLETIKDEKTSQDNKTKALEALCREYDNIMNDNLHDEYSSFLFPKSFSMSAAYDRYLQASLNYRLLKLRDQNITGWPCLVRVSDDLIEQAKIWLMIRGDIEENKLSDNLKKIDWPCLVSDDLIGKAIAEVMSREGITGDEFLDNFEKIKKAVDYLSSNESLCLTIRKKGKQILDMHQAFIYPLVRCKEDLVEWTEACYKSMDEVWCTAKDQCNSPFYDVHAMLKVHLNVLAGKPCPFISSIDLILAHGKDIPNDKSIDEKLIYLINRRLLRSTVSDQRWTETKTTLWFQEHVKIVIGLFMPNASKRGKEYDGGEDINTLDTLTALVKKRFSYIQMVIELYTPSYDLRYYEDMVVTVDHHYEMLLTQEGKLQNLEQWHKDQKRTCEKDNDHKKEIIIQLNSLCSSLRAEILLRLPLCLERQINLWHRMLDGGAALDSEKLKKQVDDVKATVCRIEQSITQRRSKLDGEAASDSEKLKKQVYDVEERGDSYHAQVAQQIDEWSKSSSGLKLQPRLVKLTECLDALTNKIESIAKSTDSQLKEDRNKASRDAKPTLGGRRDDKKKASGATKSTELAASPRGHVGKKIQSLWVKDAIRASQSATRSVQLDSREEQSPKKPNSVDVFFAELNENNDAGPIAVQLTQNCVACLAQDSITVKDLEEAIVQAIQGYPGLESSEAAQIKGSAFYSTLLENAKKDDQLNVEKEQHERIPNGDSTPTPEGGCCSSSFWGCT